MANSSHITNEHSILQDTIAERIGEEAYESAKLHYDPCFSDIFDEMWMMAEGFNSIVAYAGMLLCYPNLPHLAKYVFMVDTYELITELTEIINEAAEEIAQ